MPNELNHPISAHEIKFYQNEGMTNDHITKLLALKSSEGGKVQP